jgi:hypothetical protein
MIGFFWYPEVAEWWQYQAPIRFPAVKQGIRSWKKHLSDWAQFQEAIGGIYFTKKWRAETLQPGLEVDNFKPRFKSSIFKSISWLNGSFSGGDDRGFLKEGVRTCLVAPMSPLNSLTFNCFCLHIYSLWVFITVWSDNNQYMYCVESRWYVFIFSCCSFVSMTFSNW